jgi:hypothetical protein
MKGNTLVDVSPRPQSPGLPLYQRQYYQAAQAPMKQVTPRALLRLALRPSRDLLDELWSKSQVREVARRPELPWGSLQERAKPRPVLQPLLEQQELRRQASPRLLQARQALRWPASPPAS